MSEPFTDTQAVDERLPAPEERPVEACADCACVECCESRELDPVPE